MCQKSWDDDEAKKLTFRGSLKETLGSLIALVPLGFIGLIVYMVIGLITGYVEVCDDKPETCNSTRSL